MTVEIRQGDCRQLMLAIPEGSVDAIVTDPPYGISFVKGPTGRAAFGGRLPAIRHAGPIAGDDQPFDPSPWLRWPCVLFGANHFYDRLPPGGAFHAWDKLAYSTLEDSFSDVEFIWTSQPGKSRIISHLWKGVLRASEKNTPKFHVSQKPLAVMIQLLEWFTKPGDLILDPFAGSGTTLVACLKTGRRGLGIEISPDYCEIARRRLADAATPLLEAMEASE